MKLTESQRRVLDKIKDSPWRLYETDADAASLVRAGLVAATEQWPDGSALYHITKAGRQAIASSGGRT